MNDLANSIEGNGGGVHQRRGPLRARRRVTALQDRDRGLGRVALAAARPVVTSPSIAAEAEHPLGAAC
jgi:hypothetical protein